MQTPTTGAHAHDEARPGAAVQALYATGHWLYDQQRYFDASVPFRAMTLCDPTDERGWLALGACHEAMGELDVAAELYVKGCRRATPAPRCALSLARVHRMRGEASFAEAALARAEEMIDALGDETLRALYEAERRKS